MYLACTRLHYSCASHEHTRDSDIKMAPPALYCESCHEQNDGHSTKRVCLTPTATPAAARVSSTTRAKSTMPREIVLSAETLELGPELRAAMPLPSVDMQFVFDCQARPHLILSCKALTGPALGLCRKPSYWDLPLQLQATLVERQLQVVKQVSAIRAEVHLGSWVDGQSIHAHVVCPLVEYYNLRAKHQYQLPDGQPGQALWSQDDVRQRAQYIHKQAARMAHYHAEDAAAAGEAVASDSPQRVADWSAFHEVVFDADGSGTAAIDLTFEKAPLIKNMTHEELRDALAATRALCEDLGIDGGHLLLPSPAKEDAARIVVAPDRFVRCLPREHRLAWLEAWKMGDPVARAYREDMAQLPGGSALSSSGGAPERGSAYKRKPCRFFMQPGGCRRGDQCSFLHA